MSFLPITKEEMTARGWEAADFVYVTGDAYVDHPSFGPAIITRLLESQGYRVAVLAQPRFDTPEDMTRFGRPRLGFLVSGGNIDVNILNRVITRGLVMSGRKANLTIALEDKPGQLERVAAIVSRCGGRSCGGCAFLPSLPRWLWARRCSSSPTNMCAPTPCRRQSSTCGWWLPPSRPVWTAPMLF